jgi:diguanylate cyclase (GGDEF)-like protein
VDERSTAHSASRLLLTYALISLVPVLLLGIVLAASYQDEARRRGAAEGAAAAALVGQTAVEPLLDGHPLSEGLNAEERGRVDQLARTGIRSDGLLRLRLRDLDGRIVYSDDGSGLAGTPDDEAVEAAHGDPVTLITKLNSDREDSGPVGVDAVESYRLLRAGDPARDVGVLEVYLPYTPIARDITAGLHRLYLRLAMGLVMLAVAAFCISVLVSRGLRRQLTLNAFLAEHDVLTSLPNRTLFHRKAAAALATAERTGGSVAVAIMDLDRFKEVNDTLGHHIGDRLLSELARRLVVRGGDGTLVARLGGDEFGLIVDDADDAEAVLRRLRQAVGEEVELDALGLSVESSVGYAVAPADGTDVDLLLQRADVAMYVAKARHVGVVGYEAELDHYDAANLELIAELRHGIGAGQLVLHYQPKVRLADDAVEAVEALVRWQHPVRGLLYPDRFLPLAEQTDLIDSLTAWVLDQALQDRRALAGTGHAVSVAVNVSARNLVRPDFGRTVTSALERHGASAADLMVEITETALVTDPPRAAATLVELDAYGVRVSIDDFGKGQTSLGYLSALTIHELKVDRSFVSDMLENRAHGAIVGGIVDLGHNLGLRVVAEGVETPAQLAGLRRIGCDLAQGYLFARPMPGAELRTWLDETAPTAVWRAR